MKIKLNCNDIVCDDLEPNIKIAEFNDELNSFDKKHLILVCNSGQEFISLYEKYRDYMSIDNIAEMIKEMENIFYKYNYKKFNLKRNI